MTGRHFRDATESSPTRDRPQGRRLRTEELAVSVSLSDSLHPHPRGDKVLGTFNRLILWGLWTLTAILAVCALVPSETLSSIFGRPVSVDIVRRLALVVGAAVLGTVTLLLRRSLVGVWKWAQLPAQGSMIIAPGGLTISHDGVLDAPVELSWPDIRVIATDNGRYDRGINWRRFPIAPSAGQRPTRSTGIRRFLFATDGTPRPDLALIASRPIAPNVVILLSAPVHLRNSKADLSDVAFPPVPTAGMPARPPKHSTEAFGLLLHVRELALTRRLLLQTGLLRALAPEDVTSL